MQQPKAQRPYPDINQVVIVGTVIGDIKLKSVGAKNTAVAELAIIVNNSVGDPSAIDIQVWAGGANAVHQYTSKGDQIIVNGQLRTNTYIAKGGHTKTRIYVDAGTSGVQFTTLRRARPEQ